MTAGQVRDGEARVVACLGGKVSQNGCICRGHKHDKEHDCDSSPRENGLFPGQDISDYILAQGLRSLWESS